MCASQLEPRQIAPGVHLLTLGRGLGRTNVYVVGSGTSWAVVDTGWRGSGASIIDAARSVFGADARPAAVLLTHLHPDHSGAARELAQAWDVPVHVHPDELPFAAGDVPLDTMPLDRWVVRPILKVLPRRTRARVLAHGDLRDVVRPLDPGAAPPGLPDWECIPTPGHTPGHLAFFRRSDRVAITGDAVLTVDLTRLPDLLRRRARIAGPPGLSTWSRRAAAESVARVARLQPLLIAPGHGDPVALGGTAADLRTLSERLSAAAAGRQTAPRRGRGLAPGFLEPVDYSARVPYRRPPSAYRSLQRLAPRLAALGVGPPYVVVLEVPGRRTGEIRRTTLVQVEDGAEHYLVALAGESEWVRNVRAAQGRVVVGRRRRYAATLVELPARDRPPVIRAYLRRPGRRPGSAGAVREAERYFGLGADPTLEQIATVAEHYPVFRIVLDAAVESPAPTGHPRRHPAAEHYPLPS